MIIQSSNAPKKSKRKTQDTRNTDRHQRNPKR